jgi:hypothetical protein
MPTVSSITSIQHQPTWGYALVLGGIAAICVVLWLVNKLIMHLFPSTRQYHGNIGNALMGVEATFLPARDKVLEARQHEEKQEDDEGEPPETGPSQ